MNRICVFAGSSLGAQTGYAESAQELGTALAFRKIGLVYGGGGTGLMGVLADAVLAGGGQVTGIIPGPLVDRELAHPHLTKLVVVASMHERKARMAELADAFVALPGGLGTVEELMEIWTWAQLGIHSKPVGLLNSGRYYDPLLEFTGRMVRQGFVQASHQDLVIMEEEAGRLLDALGSHKSPRLRKWMDETEL